MKHTCQICDYSTDCKSNYNRHMKSARHQKKAGTNQVNVVERKAATFTCDACRYSTTFKSNFNRHLKSARHMKKQQKEEVPKTTKMHQCPCPGCEYTSKSSSNVKRHVLAKHSMEGKAMSKRDMAFHEILRQKGVIRRLQRMINKTNESEIKNQMKPLIEKVNRLVREYKGEDLKPSKELLEAIDIQFRPININFLQLEVLKEKIPNIHQFKPMSAHFNEYKLLDKIHELRKKINKKNEKFIKNQIRPLAEKLDKLRSDRIAKNKSDNKSAVTTKVVKPKKEIIDKEKINLLKEVEKKIKVFSDLGLDVTDYIPAAVNYENHNKDKLEELNNQLDDEDDRSMIEYIKEKGEEGCASCKYYQYKYKTPCTAH